MRHRLVAQIETGILTPGEVRSVVRQVALLSLVAELVAFCVLLVRFVTVSLQGRPLGELGVRSRYGSRWLV